MNFEEIKNMRPVSMAIISIVWGFIGIYWILNAGFSLFPLEFADRIDVVLIIPGSHIPNLLAITGDEITANLILGIAGFGALYNTYQFFFRFSDEKLSNMHLLNMMMIITYIIYGLLLLLELTGIDIFTLFGDKLDESVFGKFGYFFDILASVFFLVMFTNFKSQLKHGPVREYAEEIKKKNPRGNSGDRNYPMN